MTVTSMDNLQIHKIHKIKTKKEKKITSTHKNWKHFFFLKQNMYIHMVHYEFWWYLDINISEFHMWPQGGTLELWKWAPSEWRGSRASVVCCWELAAVALFYSDYSMECIHAGAALCQSPNSTCQEGGSPTVWLVRMMFSLCDIGIWQERSNELALESRM